MEESLLYADSLKAERFVLSWRTGRVFRIMHELYFINHKNCLVLVLTLCSSLV